MRSIAQLKPWCLAALVTAALPGAGAKAQEFYDQSLFGTVLLEKFEWKREGGRNGYEWDGQAWYGSDYNKIWLKTEGFWDGRTKQLENAELQVLYSRLLTYYFDLQIGVRHNFRPDPSRTYGVIGIQGLAPGFFEIDTQAFISEDGDISGRLNASYDLLITNRLILQPRIDINVSANRVPELGIGRGITDLEVGARLRYEFTRQFAPYIGVTWEPKVGETASIARREGNPTSTVYFVGGLRVWF